MKRILRAVNDRLTRWLSPPKPETPRQDPMLPAIAGMLAEMQAQQDRRNQFAFVHDLFEARHMRDGAWLPYGYRDTSSPEFAKRAASLRETIPVGSVGAYGDIELNLQNIEWRREINITWLEFSRWGIQQIILICRLNYIKNPIVRRLVDVCSDYVFARGVEISSPDESANEVLQDFFERNKNTLGQHALMDYEKQKDYDGNLFFVLFSDKQNSGEATVRMMDPLEVMDVVNDPEDASQPMYYRRVWTQKRFSDKTGVEETTSNEAWYPALSYQPADKPDAIGGKPVMWESPIYHRKAGAIRTWKFGCPRIYPMIDWARTAKDYLTNCATLSQALAEIAKVITTKGGQQALMGIKQQLSTQVGPGGGQSLWDINPPAVSGATFGSGPGTTIEAFKTQGAGLDPEKVRAYKLQCCMVAGVPETFLADVSTGNLATATSLDRPTETGFLAKQEAWIEDLTVLGTWALQTSSVAPSGKLREAMRRKQLDKVRVISMRREKVNGHMDYFPLAEAGLDKAKGDTATIEVKVSFPAIREGDIPAQIGGVVQAMTLGNRGGQVVGIDEKEGVRKLLVLLDVEGADELVEKMYPENGKDAYDPNRSVQDVAAPIGRAQLSPGGEPQLQGGNQRPVLDKKIEGALRQIARAIHLIEIGRANGSHEHDEPEPAATNGRG